MKDWAEYVQRTRGKRSAPLVAEAIAYVQDRDRALELGGGALADTVYLIGQGFKRVDVVDIEPSVAKIAEELKEYGSKLRVHIMPFNDFVFEQEAYDLVNAQNALPFAGREHIEEVMKNVRNSMKDEGIFCGTFFGPNDEWAIDPEIATVSREWVETFFNPQEWNMYKIEEEQAVRPTAAGKDKHWHIISVIASRTT